MQSKETVKLDLGSDIKDMDDFKAKSDEIFTADTNRATQ